MDLASLLGGVSIGPNTSGYFKISLNGLAVKTSEGRFLAYEKGRNKHGDDDRLLDVTDLPLIDPDNFVFRILVRKNRVKRSDVIIASDQPFIAYFAKGGVEHGHLRILDPGDNADTVQVPPANPK